MRRIKLGKRFIIIYFVFGSCLLAIFWFFFSAQLLKRLAEETEVRSRIFAKYMSRITEAMEASSTELDIIFEEVIKKIDFPLMLTDDQGNIVSYRNLGKNLSLKDLQRIKERLGRRQKPIPLTFVSEEGEQFLGEIYYGQSKTAQFVSLFPYLQIFFLVVFLLIGGWAIVVYKRREEEKLWTFLAKETAHQLATPLSSFSGWLVNLQSTNPQIVKEMEADIERMSRVLERFSRIGQTPKLSPCSIKEVIEETYHFIQRRTPQNINMVLNIKEDASLLLDEVLLSWSLENLLKNSIDAIGQKPGAIILNAQKEPGGRYYKISITDTGEGISHKKKKEIFSPGITTKKYGWGVGLPLAKRIVEEYHKGKLVLVESKKGKTIFSILLPLGGIERKNYAGPLD